MKLYDKTFDVLLKYGYSSIEEGKESEFMYKIIEIYKDSFNKTASLEIKSMIQDYFAQLS